MTFRSDPIALLQALLTTPRRKLRELTPAERAARAAADERAERNRQVEERKLKKGKR